MKCHLKWVCTVVLTTLISCNQNTNIETQCHSPKEPHTLIYEKNERIGFVKSYTIEDNPAGSKITLNEVVITQKNQVEPWAIAGKMKEMNFSYEKKDLYLDFFTFDVTDQGNVLPQDHWVKTQVLDGEDMTTLEECVLFKKVELQVQEIEPHQRSFYPDIQISI